MPELNVTAAPALVASAPPSPEGVDAGSAEGQPSEPFAAVLQQAAQAAMGTAVVDKPAVTLLAADAQVQDAEPDIAGNAELAAILPMLMAVAVPEKAEAAAAEASAALAAGESGEEASELAVLTTAAPIEAPKGNGPSPVAALPPGQERAALLDHGQAALLNRSRPANPAAIPAATPAKVDAAIADAVKAAPSRGGFEELLSAAREAQPQPGMGPAVAHSGANASASAPVRVETPVGMRGWDAEVGNRLVWMAGRQESHAELVLNPPQMGRIEVSLSVSGDQATAQFVSASPAVREALENALPRLRELLADAGVTLGQAQVGSESAGQSAKDRENGDNSSLRGPADAAADGGGLVAGLAGSPANPWLRTGRSLVDVFA